MTIIAERVARGAALLDAEMPGWWKPGAPNPVSLPDLDIDNCERCVLGQVFNPGAHDRDSCGYNAGLDVLGVRAGENEYDYGFDAPWSDRDALTAEWRKVITARREAAS